MSGSLAAPPSNLMQRAPAAPAHPAPENTVPESGPPQTQMSQPKLPALDKAAAQGRFAALQQAGRDVMDGTADCAVGVTQSPTGSPYSTLKNTPLSPHDQTFSDPNAGKFGVEGGIRITVPFATGGRKGLEVGTPSVDARLGPTGKGGATACVVGGVTNSAVNAASGALNEATKSFDPRIQGFARGALVAQKQFVKSQ